MCETPQIPKKDRWYDIVNKLTPIVIGICVTGLGIVFEHTYHEKEIQLSKINTQLSQLKALNDFLPHLKSENSSERAFAYEAFVALGYEDLMIKIVTATKDPSGRPALQTVVHNEQGTNREAAKNALNVVPVYVYLHIADESQRDAAIMLKNKIDENLHYLVQGIENITGKVSSPMQASIRYFNDSDRNAAEAISKLLKDQGIVIVNINKLLLKAKPGTIEVWYPSIN
jgi:hypothetical protein